MSYFSKLPSMYYSLSKPGEQVKVEIVKDIFVRAGIRNELRDNIFIYDEYDIKDGETPEMLADQFYGDSELHWIILLTNEIHDFIYDWPMTERALNKYVKKKYTRPLGVHHYRKRQTSGDPNIWITVDASLAGAAGVYPVSNLEYEESENEKKRRIKILKKEALGEFISEFEKIMDRQ